MNNDDIILVKKCLEGDRKSFEEIVEKYHKVVVKLAYRIIRNIDDAEEITQIVFIKAYESLDTYNSKYKFFSWLYRITVNESLNFSKRKSFTEKLYKKHNSNDKNPESIYESTETGDNIHDALMELDIIYRIPVVLKHFLDYSYKEISDLIDIPEKTVKSRLFTGRQLLKDILVKKGFYYDRKKIHRINE